MNKYFESSTLLNNLMDHYHRFGSIVVAFDFDNTIRRYDNGEPIREVIELLRDLNSMNCVKLFCYTSRGKDEFDFIRAFMESVGLSYHTPINENVVEVPWLTDGAKLYYNIFLDDKCGLGQAYDVLKLYANLVYMESGENDR